MNELLKELDASAFLRSLAARSAAAASAPQGLPDQADGARRLAALRHPREQRLRVVSRKEQPGGACLFTLESAEEKPLAGFLPGQTLSVTVPVDGVPLSRPYSLCSSPNDKEYQLCVKPVPGGLVSNAILRDWQPGTWVTASDPWGDFVHEPLRDAPLVIAAAGGSGVTPFLSMARAIHDGLLQHELIILSGSKSLKDALLLPELQEACCDRVRVIPVPEERDGFIDREMLLHAAAGRPFSLFLCGPEAMVEALSDQMADCPGLRSLRREVPAECPVLPGEAVHITLIAPDGSCVIPGSTGVTLLRSLEIAGIAHPNRCRGGVCGFCHTRLLSGRVRIPEGRDHRRQADESFGFIHPCCALPLEDVTLECPYLLAK